MKPNFSQQNKSLQFLSLWKLFDVIESCDIRNPQIALDEENLHRCNNYVGLLINLDSSEVGDAPIWLVISAYGGCFLRNYGHDLWYSLLHPFSKVDVKSTNIRLNNLGTFTSNFELFDVLTHQTLRQFIIYASFAEPGSGRWERVS